MASGHRTISDLAGMRAISHPVRLAILEKLWAGDVLTATQAAELVGLTSSAASYHLQHLAKRGFIERVDTADGREHPWRATNVSVGMSGQPDARLGRTMMRNLAVRVMRILDTPPPVPVTRRPWPAGHRRAQLRLTKAEAKQLRRRIDEAIEEFEVVSAAHETGTPSGAEVFNYEAVWISGVVIEADQS
ncbi:MAG: helix-turn-helix domain-containing protein [Actinomycetota bacterium]|nr:helix-turn-helix domain-containing protein [Actinomycetota bacterium]